MSGKLNRRIKSEDGTVLLSALAVLSILAVSLTGVLIFGGWQRTQGLVYLDEVRANSLAESGIHDAIASLADNPQLRRLERDLSLDSANHLSYSIRPWGAFLQVKCTGKGRLLSQSMTAIVGMRPPVFYDHAIIAIGSGYPLVISGSTEVVGDIFVGPKGVTAGEINGRGFHGEQLVDGRIDTILPSVLPRFDDSVLEEFLDSLSELVATIRETDLSLLYTDVDKQASEETAQAKSVRTRADIEFNFSNALAVPHPQFYFADRSIRITGRSHLRGIVLCAGEVLMSHNSQLEDCIIVADRVRLADDSRFAGQIIVKDTVIVENHATLDHSTLLILRGRKTDKNFSGLVEIRSSGTIEATVVYGRLTGIPENDGSNHTECRLRVAKNVRMSGLIWWEGTAELCGTFSGAIAVNCFSHYVQPTTYMNWLVDTEIHHSDLASTTAFPLVFAQLKHPRVSSLVRNESR